MRVDVSGQNFVFPNECACCCSAPDAEMTISASRSRGSRVVHTETKTWDVPYCVARVGHIGAMGAARSLARSLTFLSVLLGVIVGFVVDPYWGIATGILAIAGTILIHGRQLGRVCAQCGPNCVDVDVAIAYLGWYGTLHKFEIGSRQFACDFMTANQTKLVNLSREGITLLSASGSGLKAPISRSPRRYVG